MLLRLWGPTLVSAIEVAPLIAVGVFVPPRILGVILRRRSERTESVIRPSLVGIARVGIRPVARVRIAAV
jgi:hypothetical protein